MTPEEAQDIAERWANFHSEKLTLDEIKGALVCLANWYEDTQFDMKHRSKVRVDKIAQAITILKGSTWQSMNDKMIVHRVIKLLGNAE